MPQPRTPEQVEKAEIRYLRTLANGPLGGHRVLEQFEEHDGIIYRKMQTATWADDLTRQEMIELLDHLAEGMVPEAVHYSVEAEFGGGGDDVPKVVCKGRRQAFPGEVEMYRAAQRTDEEKRAAAQAERDRADLARLRKTYPDQFKET